MSRTPLRLPDNLPPIASAEGTNVLSLQRIRRNGIIIVRIREEQAGDRDRIRDLIVAAFAGMPESVHREHLLVGRLHEADTFIPELSLVAETDEGRVVGYVLLTRVEIVSEAGAEPSLSVASLAVLPEFQGRGIGGMLLGQAHRRAAALGYGTAVLLGHKDYYPRFGYRRAADFGIAFPFEAPSESCMIVELIPHAAGKSGGIVRYPDVFFE